MQDSRYTAETPDSAQIARIIDGIRQIDDAGLLRDYRLTVASELRALAQRQADARYGYGVDGVGRYVADLLGIDRARCERIAVGTRAQVVLAEIESYLHMIEERRQREAQRDRAVAAERRRRSRVMGRATV